MDSKNGIGKENDLLFRIPEDFARMQSLTMGHPIIMGRKTFESIGRVLPKRANIVITQNPDFQPQNVTVVHSFEEGIEKAKEAEGAGEIFIFGGGQIFKEALEKNIVDTLYLTIVEARLDSPPESPARRGDFGADTFFPDFSKYKIKSEEERESNGYKYKFLTLER